MELEANMINTGATLHPGPARPGPAQPKWGEGWPLAGLVLRWREEERRLQGSESCCCFSLPSAF
jgi:hypothetical protein